MFYELEERELFSPSLERLEPFGDPDRMAKAVAMLIGWILEHPKSAVANKHGIRVAKLPSMQIDGGMTRPIRIAYHLFEGKRPSGADGVVTLFHVEIYDEAQEIFDGGTVPPRSH